MTRDEIMHYLNNIFNRLAEKYGTQEAIKMFDETIGIAKVISIKKRREE